MLSWRLWGNRNMRERCKCVIESQRGSEKGWLWHPDRVPGLSRIQVHFSSAGEGSPPGLCSPGYVSADTCQVHRHIPASPASWNVPCCWGEQLPHCLLPSHSSRSLCAGPRGGQDTAFTSGPQHSPWVGCRPEAPGLSPSLALALPPPHSMPHLTLSASGQTCRKPWSRARCY